MYNNEELLEMALEFEWREYVDDITILFQLFPKMDDKNNVLINHKRNIIMDQRALMEHYFSLLIKHLACKENKEKQLILVICLIKAFKLKDIEAINLVLKLNHGLNPQIPLVLLTPQTLLDDNLKNNLAKSLLPDTAQLGLLAVIEEIEEIDSIYTLDKDLIDLKLSEFYQRHITNHARDLKYLSDASSKHEDRPNDSLFLKYPSAQSFIQSFHKFQEDIIKNQIKQQEEVDAESKYKSNNYECGAYDNYRTFRDIMIDKKGDKKISIATKLFLSSTKLKSFIKESSEANKDAKDRHIDLQLALEVLNPNLNINLLKDLLSQGANPNQYTILILESTKYPQNSSRIYPPAPETKVSQITLVEKVCSDLTETNCSEQCSKIEALMNAGAIVYTYPVGYFLIEAKSSAIDRLLNTLSRMKFPINDKSLQIQICDLFALLIEGPDYSHPYLPYRQLHLRHPLDPKKTMDSYNNLFNSIINIFYEIPAHKSAASVYIKNREKFEVENPTAAHSLRRSITSMKRNLLIGKINEQNCFFPAKGVESTLEQNFDLFDGVRLRDYVNILSDLVFTKDGKLYAGIDLICMRNKMCDNPVNPVNPLEPLSEDALRDIEISIKTSADSASIKKIYTLAQGTTVLEFLESALPGLSDYISEIFIEKGGYTLDFHKELSAANVKRNLLIGKIKESYLSKNEIKSSPEEKFGIDSDVEVQAYVRILSNLIVTNGPQFFSAIDLIFGKHKPLSSFDLLKMAIKMSVDPSIKKIYNLRNDTADWRAHFGDLPFLAEYIKFISLRHRYEINFHTNESEVPTYVKMLRDLVFAKEGKFYSGIDLIFEKYKPLSSSDLLKMEIKISADPSIKKIYNLRNDTADWRAHFEKLPFLAKYIELIGKEGYTLDFEALTASNSANDPVNAASNHGAMFKASAAANDPKEANQDDSFNLTNLNS